MKTFVVGALFLLSLICMVEAAPSMSCVGLCEVAKNDCVDAPCDDPNEIPCSVCYAVNDDCKDECNGKK